VEQPVWRFCARLSRAGERNPERLATLKHNRVRASREEIARSLEGNWREELLFVLEQSLELYDLYVRKISVCDQRIERHLKIMAPKREPGQQSDPAALTAAKQQPHFQPQGPTLPHHRSRPNESRGSPGTDRADDHIRDRCRYEPLENGKTVCLVAGSLPR
jgi:hypothetical protein